MIQKILSSIYIVFMGVLIFLMITFNNKVERIVQDIRIIDRTLLNVQSIMKNSEDKLNEMISSINPLDKFLKH